MTKEPHISARAGYRSRTAVPDRWSGTRARRPARYVGRTRACSYLLEEPSPWRRRRRRRHRRSGDPRRDRARCRAHRRPLHGRPCLRCVAGARRRGRRGHVVPAPLRGRLLRRHALHAALLHAPRRARKAERRAARLRQGARAGRERRPRRPALRSAAPARRPLAARARSDRRSARELGRVVGRVRGSRRRARRRAPARRRRPRRGAGDDTTRGARGPARGARAPREAVGAVGAGGDRGLARLPGTPRVASVRRLLRGERWPGSRRCSSCSAAAGCTRTSSRSHSAAAVAPGTRARAVSTSWRCATSAHCGRSCSSPPVRAWSRSCEDRASTSWPSSPRRRSWSSSSATSAPTRITCSTCRSSRALVVAGAAPTARPWFAVTAAAAAVLSIGLAARHTLLPDLRALGDDYPTEPLAGLVSFDALRPLRGSVLAAPRRVSPGRPGRVRRPPLPGRIRGRRSTSCAPGSSVASSRTSSCSRPLPTQSSTGASTSTARSPPRSSVATGSSGGDRRAVLGVRAAHAQRPDVLLRNGLAHSRGKRIA